MIRHCLDPVQIIPITFLVPAEINKNFPSKVFKSNFVVLATKRRKFLLGYFYPITVVATTAFDG